MNQYDVVVLGAGPAGTTVAGLLSQQGIKVLVVEGKAFPREHIGESLLSISVPHLERLGVAEKIKAAGFVEKLGSTFVWGPSPEPHLLTMPPPGYAWQVDRSRFDQILLEHVRELGADVWQEHWAQAPVVEGGRVVGVTVRDSAGQEREVRCRLLVDAAGNAFFLAKRLSLPIEQHGPKRVSIYGYIQTSARMQGIRPTDNISEACRDGWLWFIPLSDDLVSVGFVGDESPETSGRPETVFMEQLASSRFVRSMCEHGTLTRRVTVCRYRNHVAGHPWGNGYVQVGDCATFVDPLFATGVHSAFFMADLAAAGIATVLRTPALEPEISRWYEQRIHSYYARTRSTINLLYGLHPGESPFWRSRQLPEGLPEEAAEEIAATLGAVGMAFFSGAHRAGGLVLPPALARKIPEFYSQPVPTAPLAMAEVLALHPDCYLKPDWIPHHGRLEPGITVVHRLNRVPPLEFRHSRPSAQALELVDGRRTVGEIVDLVGGASATWLLKMRNVLPVWLGNLAAMGVLTVDQGVRAGSRSAERVVAV